jgi:selenide,water dikinase
VPTHPDVLVGLHTGDDAGVVRLTGELALVQTVDFITPVVDDPFRFGQVAAANSLSDVYAMGGSPLTAMNVLAYPACDVSNSTVAAILAGGADKIAEAGASLVGGHTVDNPELVYGLAVTGRVHPGRFLTNAGARPGDRLVLTKPLGLGLLATAVKAGLAGPQDAAAMAEVMAALNRVAGEALQPCGADAATDVTGFGFAGHALGIARESGVDLVVQLERIPVLGGARHALATGMVPAGAYRNRDAYRERLQIRRSDADDTALLLCDPQTSGGLLVALPPQQVAPYLDRVYGARGGDWAREIGEVATGAGALIVE